MTKHVGYYGFQDSEIFVVYEIQPDTICPGPMLGRIFGRQLAEVLGQMTVPEAKQVLSVLTPVLVDPSL